MSVPYSMHAVGKVRDNMKKDGGCGAGNGASASSAKQAPGWQGQGGQASLQSYSSKMMKSIWGEYNRYSVHNFKSSQNAGPAAGSSQDGSLTQRAPGGRGSGLFQ